MMDSERPSTFLTPQHRDIDKGILGITEGGGSVAELADALRLLHWHIYLEEELLFPVLEHGGITMPVFVMKREHGQMWPLLLQLLADCEAGKTATELKADCAELFKLLQIHNPKEEQIVYGSADDLTKKGYAESLRATLEAADPDDAQGWSCAMAPG